MPERYKGEEQLLSEAIGRVFHIRARAAGRDRRPQFQITIPAAIARLMLESSNSWRWKLTDEGVLLEPATEDDPSELPAWAKKRDARSAKRTRRPERPSPNE